MSFIHNIPANQHSPLEKLQFILQHKLDATPGSTSAQPAEIPGSQVTPIPSQGNVLEKINAELSEFLKDQNNQLNFKVDEQTGDVVISVVNQQTKEVIKHIPIDNMTLDQAQIRDLNNLFYNGQA